VGATKRPSYRVVAIDSRRPRDGRALDILGFYDPLTDPATVQIDADKVKAWMDKGALPSETVVKLMRQAGIGGVPAAPVTAPKKRAPVAKTATADKPAAATAPAPAAAAVAEAPADETPAEEATAEAAEPETKDAE
jgi:small subunit ribosomal protein S16